MVLGPAALGLALAGASLLFGCSGRPLGQTGPGAAVPDAHALPKLFAWVLAEELDQLGPAYLGAVEGQARAAWQSCPEGAAGEGCRVAAVAAQRDATAKTRARIKAAISAQNTLATEADALAACAAGSDCYAQHARALRASLADLRTMLVQLRAEVCRAPGGACGDRSGARAPALPALARDAARRAKPLS